MFFDFILRQVGLIFISPSFLKKVASLVLFCWSANVIGVVLIPVSKRALPMRYAAADKCGLGRFCAPKYSKSCSILFAFIYVRKAGSLH